MDKNPRPDELRQLSKETDELLDKLEEVGKSNEGNRQNNPTQKRNRELSPLYNSSSSARTSLTSTNSKISEGKRNAFMLRQKDTGWGRSLVHTYVPFYVIYYAASRRTITPWLWAIVFCIGAAITIRLVLHEKSEKELEQLGQLTGIVVAPFGFRFGTNKAREYARKRLEEI